MPDKQRPFNQREQPVTPAIDALKKANIAYQLHQYIHDKSNESFGLEAAEKLGVPPAQVFKTLVVCINSCELAVAIVPVAKMLSMKLVAKACGAKKADMAKPLDVERSTGYVLGGVSPLGQRKRLKTVIHCSALEHPSIYISGGKRGLEIELSAQDLNKLVNGTFADICQ